MIEVEVANQQQILPIDAERLAQAVREILQSAGFRSGSVSLAVVDDPEIHRLNREHLAHDYPTDVLSFLFSDEDGIEGEIIVSAATAARTAPRYHWDAHDELLLYVIHGSLHLVGYDDQTPDAKAKMQQREREQLARFGLHPQYDERDAPL
jgi:probable rRNA maturation factor